MATKFLSEIEPVQVAQKILEKIHLLEQGRARLQSLAQKRAETMGEYDKQIAIILMQLRAGKAMQLDGETIKDPPATICEKLAKGLCYQALIDMELADANYKLAVKKLEAVEVEMNGLQSVNRYLDVSPEHGRINK